ncbi:hypothetical protein [Nostoc sp.]|uniref:hypothetical protein n=1 Tax=Nostoc sp. TaxID=1180 RepID=UPI002FFB707E
MAVELLKIGPVPPCFFSEWVPAERLIQGLGNSQMPLRYRLQLLQRLSQEPSLEARLQVAESPETPSTILEQLAGDLELPVQLAVKFNPSCPPSLIELVEGQYALAFDWNTDSEQLAMLGQSRWADQVGCGAKSLSNSRDADAVGWGCGVQNSVSGSKESRNTGRCFGCASRKSR